MNLKPWQTSLLLVGAAGAALAWLVSKCDWNPQINFLPRDSRAQWIIFPAPVDPRSHAVAMMDATFRRTFSLAAKPQTAQLLIRAAKRLELKINGQSVQIPPSQNWKEVSTSEVQNFLRSGDNEIQARVFNDDAPPALWIRIVSTEGDVTTDASWSASIAGSSWRSCALAAVARHPGPGNLLGGGEKVADVLPRVWLVWICFGALALVIVFAITKWLRLGQDEEFTGGQVAALLGVCAVAWGVLFWNNARTLPFHCGYDHTDHLAYIKYIQERRALPVPTEGFEMFQPPLYYAVSAGVLSMFRLSINDEASVGALRALTMLFGIANFILVFFSIRLLFPRQRILQLVGLLIAAFLPMQLYLSHYVTNETLAGTLASATLYLALRVLMSRRAALWILILTGVALGAAMLAKATSLLLLPPLFGALLYKLVRERGSVADNFRVFGTVIVSMTITCGWHYFRIWHQFGTPIVGNWDSKLGFAWWQDPGFHTAADYFRAGRALISPLFSGFNGFADGIFSTLWGDSLCGGLSGLLSRTPWNYPLMIAGYWVALIPTALVVIGIATAMYYFARKPSPEWFLLITFSAAMLVALIFMTLRVASYAQVKAFYGLSAVVPFCCFAVLGWRIVTDRRRAAQFLIAIGIGFFAINSFAAVWIRPSTEQRIYGALRFIAQSEITRALEQATSAGKTDPFNPNASYVLAAVLDESGDSTKAVAECARCLELEPSSGDCHFQLAVSLAKQGQVARAMTEAQRAMQLLPESPRVYDLLGALDRELHHDREAIDAARDALAVSPFDADLHYRAGLAAGQAGDFAMAAAQFAYAVLLNPKKPEHGERLRVALSFLKQSPDGQNVIRDLQSLASGSPKLLEILKPYAENSDPGMEYRQ